MRMLSVANQVVPYISSNRQNDYSSYVFRHFFFSILLTCDPIGVKIANRYFGSMVLFQLFLHLPCDNTHKSYVLEF